MFLLRTLEREAAEVLAGRANTVSAWHYLMVEVDRLAGQVVEAWDKFGIREVKLEHCQATIESRLLLKEELADFLTSVCKYLAFDK